MDELGRIFIHHVEYRNAVCTTCQFAVVPSQVSPMIADSSNALVSVVCTVVSDCHGSISAASIPT
jgi:hypothetical protein